MQMLLPVVKRGWCAIVYGGVAKVKLRLIIRRFPGAVCFDRGPRSDVSHLSLIALCVQVHDSHVLYSRTVMSLCIEAVDRSREHCRTASQYASLALVYSAAVFISGSKQLGSKGTLQAYHL